MFSVIENGSRLIEYFERNPIAPEEIFKQILPNRETPLVINTRVRFGEKYDKELVTALFAVGSWLDQEFERQIGDLAALDPPRMELKFSQEQVAKQQKNYLARVNIAINIADVSGVKDRLTYGFPMCGAASIMNELAKRYPDLIDSFFPLPVWGSKRNTTGGAEIRGTLDNRLTDKENIVLILEDVTDSVMTAIRFALLRKGEREGNLGEYTDLVGNIEKLRKKKKPFTDPDLVKEYDRAAKLFMEEKVVFAPIYSKNAPFTDSLRKWAQIAIENSEKDAVCGTCGVMQTTVLGYDDDKNDNKIVMIREDEWIMGGKGEWDLSLLDTGISGEDLLSKLVDYQGYLEKVGFRDYLVRIGPGMRGLYIFDPKNTKQLFPELVETVAQPMKIYLDWFLQVNRQTISLSPSP